MPHPVVAVVGRPNVGKSCLFNRLAGRRIAIVDPTSGVTRDRVATEVEHAGRRFDLTDTGGMGVEDPDALSTDIERHIDLACQQADVIIFVVDVRAGLLPLDRHVADRLRHLDTQVILVANKAETRPLRQQATEFFALGFGEPMPVSAQEGLGRTDLLDLVVDRLPAAGEAPDEPVLKLAIVGRRNVGKSTFINALAREERMIVSKRPGTTRDAVDVRFERDGRAFLAIDTAGVRRKSSVADSVEFYSQARTERSIRRCDVAALMLDAIVAIGRVEKHLARTIADRFKPCIIVVNKWDLHGEATTGQFRTYLEAHLPGLWFAPLVFTTAKTGRHVASVVDVAQALHRQARTRVTTGELNRVIAVSLKERSPRPRRNRLPKVYYATQVSVEPPTVVLFVNDPRLFSAGYKRYLANRLRERLPFAEVPIRLHWRSHR